MSLSTFFNSIDMYVKIKPWLQFVGYMLNSLGVLAAALGHKSGFYVAGIATGISMAGWLYKKLYP